MKRLGLTSLALGAVLPLALAGCGVAQGATTGAPEQADPAASAVLGGPSTSQFCQAFAHFEANVLARTQRSVRRASSVSPTDDMRQTQAEIQENMRQDADDLAGTVPFAPPDIKPDVIKDVEQFQHMTSSDSTPIDEQPAYHVNAWVHTHCG